MKSNFNRSGFIVVALCAVTILTTVSSCKKFLQENPRTSLGVDSAFSSVESAYKVLIGAYSQLAGDQGYGIRLSLYFTVDTDEMMGPTGNPDGDRRDIARYLTTATNAQLNRPFLQLYTGIERANICIANIPKMEQYNGGTELEKLKLRRMLGEAYTLRAQFYFELIRNWGDVPAQFQPSSAIPDLYLPRTNRDEIYDVILGNLEEAETLVPWRTEVTSLLGEPDDERITQGAVRALRARIALFRGGYSLRVASKLMERGTDYIKYYTIARDECAAIMAKRNEHDLYRDGDNPFRKLWKDVVCAHDKSSGAANGEILFQVAMFGNNSGEGGSKLGYYNGPRVNGTRGNGLFIVPSYFYEFDKLDTRKDVTVAPYTVNADGFTKTGIAITSMADGKYRSDWISNPSIPVSSSSQYYGLNWVVIRFADVLLMFAEAENELNSGATPAAVSAFEEVRKRGFGENAAQIGVTPTDKEGFFAAIVKERLLEFGDEGIRKYDLIRWNLLGTKIAEAKDKLRKMSVLAPPYDGLPKKMFYTANASTADDYSIWFNGYYEVEPSPTPGGTTGVTWLSPALDPDNTANPINRFANGFTANKNELMPIPQESFDANYNIKIQNPGY